MSTRTERRQAAYKQSSHSETYMVLASDDNDSVNGDTNRGNLLAMLKLMAKMQHIFRHKAQITSLTSLHG